MIIPRTADAVNAILHVDQFNQGGILRLIGEVTTETVTLWQPAVHPGLAPDDAITELDPDNESHWMEVVYDYTPFELNVGNVALAIPHRGTFRVKKDAGAIFGVGYYDYNI